MRTGEDKQDKISHGSIPAHWQWVRIGDLVNKMVGGCSTKKTDYVTDGVLVLNKGHIKTNGFVNLGNQKRYVTLKYANDNPGKIIKNNTIVVTLRDLSVKADFLGLIGIYKGVEDGLITQGMCSLDLNDSVVPSYLVYFSNAPFYRYYVKENKVGSTQVHLRNGQFLNAKIPLAPLEQQKRIVAEIEKQFSRLDEAVANLKRVKANLKRYKAAVLKAAVEGRLVETEAEIARREGRDYETGAQLLQHILKTRRNQLESKGKYKEPTEPDTSDLPRLPDGWVWATVGAFLQDIEAGKSFKCEERPPTKEEVGVVKVSAVSWGEFDENESKTCHEKHFINEKLLIRPGDFLFSRANTIELVGACVIAKKVTSKVMLSDKILRFRLLGGLDEWVLYTLRSKFGRGEIESLATGNQESMRNIGQGRIRVIRIPLPPLDESGRIVAEIQRRLSLVDEIDEQIGKNLRRALQLRQSILGIAFSGKI